MISLYVKPEWRDKHNQEIKLLKLDIAVVLGFRRVKFLEVFERKSGNVSSSLLR